MDKTVKFNIKLESTADKDIKNITINSEELRDVIADIQKEVKSATSSFDRFAQSAMAVDAASSVFSNFNTLVSQGAQNFANFDKGMRAVNTMAGLNADDLARLTNEVSELGKNIPIAREQLANGLYQVISNGVPEDNWITFLEQSSKAAVGGIADLGQTVTVTSTILKNYGLEWEAAGEIQDKIQTTAKLGVTSFEQLAAALPRVTGTAATLGVSVDDLMAAFATLTGVTGNTAEVSTQLAAVFTALTKPSSEATTMAQQMGIQFDAAAVKAAGGFRNFLTQIDADIKAYASAHGQLDQEIYGKLFGSAESLRALVALNGELSDKFGQNIEAMSSSAGTCSAAFNEMSGSLDAQMQISENVRASNMDWAASILAVMQPYTKAISTFAQTFATVVLLTSATKKLISTIRSQVAAATAGRVATAHLAAADGAAAVAAGTATVATKGFTLSIKAMYAAATFGASIIAGILIDALMKYINKCEDAGKATDRVDEAMEAYKNASTSAQAAIAQEIAKLKELIAANADTSQAVQELNNKYGDIFGSHATAAEWYDTLIKKSRAYCTQLGYEAQAKALAATKAQKEMELQEINDKIDDINKSGKGTKKKAVLTSKTDEVTGTTFERSYIDVPTDEMQQLLDQQKQLQTEIAETGNKFDECNKKAVDAAVEIKGATTSAGNAVAKSIDWQKQSYTDLGKTIEQQKTKVAGLAGVNSAEAKKEAAVLKQMQERYKSLGKAYGLSDSSKSSDYDGKKLIANAASYKELGNNVKYYQDQLEKTKNTEAAAGIAKKLEEVKAQQAQVKIELDAAGLPAEAKTLDDYNRKIKWLQGVREISTEADLPGIDEEIEKAQQAKEALEDLAIAGKQLSDYATYDDISKGLAYYEKQINSTSGTVQAEARKMKKSLEDLRKAMDDSGTTVTAPDMKDLSTAQKLNEAISYLKDKQARSTHEEATSLQVQIDKLERMSSARQKVLSLPQQQRELSQLNGMSGKELKMELELIGLDGIKSKIRELQQMLRDTENPLGDEQRKEVQQTLGSWQKYERQLKKSKTSMRGAWNAAEDIGDSMRSMVSTLKGNATVWEKVCSVVDGFIRLYDGFDAITGIIRLFTAGTKQNAAAQSVNAAAATGAAAAEAASEGVMAAALPVVKTSTAAYQALAVAKTYAAYAEIPFVGFGLASGFSASIMAAVKGASIPTFANGGLAYGPTLGIFGEYAGAANNPEVVAPLDRLKALIADGSSPMGGELTVRMRGRDLVGVYKREMRTRRRIG